MCTYVYAYLRPFVSISSRQYNVNRSKCVKKIPKYFAIASMVQMSDNADITTRFNLKKIIYFPVRAHSTRE